MEINQNNLQMYTYEQALSKAAAICSQSEKCISEIRNKLTNWEVFPETADKVIDELVKLKFIDETRYARFFTRDKLKFNKWGKIKIEFMLKSKDVDKAIIKESLEAIDIEEYHSILKEILTQKNRSIKSGNSYEKKIKLTRFAQSRGFEFEAINLALKAIEI